MSANGHSPDPPPEGLDAAGLIALYQRLRRQGARMVYGALFISLILVGIFGLTQTTSPPLPLDVTRLGLHLLLDDGRHIWPESLWEAHLAAAGGMLTAGGYVVQLVRLDDLNIERWQTLLDLAETHDLQPVLRLATTYDSEGGYWLAPPRDDDDETYAQVARAYADFLGQLRWPSPPLILLLNEPNRGDEWGGRPDGGEYARFVAQVAPAIRERLPSARLLNAALDLHAPDTGGQPFVDGIVYQSAPRFLDAMAEAVPDVFAHFDWWNSHPYPMGAFRQPPWEQAYTFDEDPAPPPDVFNLGVNGYEWELWKLEQLGAPSRPVFISETGWRTGPAPEGVTPYPDATSATAYLDLALRGNPGRYPHVPRTGWTPWLVDERIVGVALFALNGDPASWGHSNLLSMGADGTILGTTRLGDLLPRILVAEGRR